MTTDIKLTIDQKTKLKRRSDAESQIYFDMENAQSFIDYDTAEEWRVSELNNRNCGLFNAAVRCQERADQIEKHGGYWSPVFMGEDSDFSGM